MLCDNQIGEMGTMVLKTDKKKIILSYDYELFFGERSGTVLKSIVEPTNILMEVMEKNGFRGNFFVDYLMFRELEKQTEDRAQQDLKLLKDQLRDMVRRGHRVELHLHPHWIDAKYNGDGTWNFDNFSHYSLSSLDEETIVDMFKQGTIYLTTIAREVEPDYKIIAFRAGGWAVQPFNKLRRGFMEAGIKIDSSTSFGIYKYMKDSYYDFREMPDRAMFHFEDDVCKDVKGGRFIEVPITSFHIPFSRFVIERHKRNHTSYFKTFADGTHHRRGVPQDSRPFVTKMFEKAKSSYRNMLNFSSMSPSTLQGGLKHMVNNLICAIDHPKDVCEGTLKGLNSIAPLCESINYVDLIK